MITSWPCARNAAAVRCASGSGRVSRSRTVNPARRNRRRRGAFSSRPASAPSSAASARGAFAQNLERGAAVGLYDHAAELDGAVVDPCVAADRRAAGAVEHGEESALGGHRGRGIGIVDLGDQRARRRVVGAGLDADRALADRRQKFVDVEQCRRGSRAGRAASSRRRQATSRPLRRPRACASASPRCRAAARSARSGRKRLHHRLPPQRGGADHRAARQIAQALWPWRLMKASRASSRGKNADSTRPGGSTVGMSFDECTARSMAPLSSASSISLVNSPLPPVVERTVLDRVAGGADDFDLDPRGVEAAGQGEAALHLARLHQRQRRAARADAQDDSGRGLCHEPFRC